MKHYFLVGVREVHVSHRMVCVEDEDGNPSGQSLEECAISKALEEEVNEVFLEYSYTMEETRTPERASEDDIANFYPQDDSEEEQGGG